ncbi:uncharacterized protein BO95DRAFT_437669 [Aspergillus brunneoviolaceus CBS 621.78]|uniref:Uncharacterized protein n=1 Tax=Aspergillus brunneoviolaceus CBS 621.78 TaxID=1450534 RepID=A0ACD1GQH5_9EURO|nr:hypothetical protein BO95DRAFT_437669 [Aspergillus brunneoviolaceus CBS 621.78]RAH51492.1 hypothetical protein BO95DRAFT_437669 [Aspergillus brunneoviolaceus CBS 621.78]
MSDHTTTTTDNTTEILLTSLPTKTVTFQPTRATIVREVPVTIHPGPNTLTIHGLDPQTDFDSIRIEGSGPACVTDFQTEVVKSRLYALEANEGEQDVSSSDSSSSEDDEADDEPEELRLVRAELRTAKEKAALAGIRRDVAGSLIDFLQEQKRGSVFPTAGAGFGRPQQQQPQVEVYKVGEFMDLYNARGKEEGEKHYRALVEVEEAEEDVARLMGKVQKVEKRVFKEKRKKEAAREKERQARRKEKMQRKERKERLEKEQKSFRKDRVGEVVVHLDGEAPFADADADDGEGKKQGDNNVMLRLSYVVAGPSWVPRYDLSINTPASSAKMVYRAEFRNACSETWRDARVTLSTSQASFSGLGERIPSLQAWQLMVQANNNNKNQEQTSWENILRSKPEQRHLMPVQTLHKSLSQQQQQQQQPSRNASVFGPNHVVTAAASRPFGNTAPAAPPQQVQGGLFGQAAAPPPPPPPARQSGGALFGGLPPTTTSGPLFGAPANPPPTGTSGPQSGGFGRAMSGGLFGSVPGPSQAQPTALMSTTTASMQPFAQSGENDPTQEGPKPSFGSPPPPPPPKTIPDLEHQESFQQDYGLTTTYDLPGHRTVIPSLVARRHLLADLHLDSVTLSYTIVPKQRAAAFLQAKIQNSSASVSLLRGKVGITIDGTFLGTADLPSCGPKKSFTLPLGVDPLIQVTYGRPTMRRTTGSGGLFSQKEEAAVFRRTCRVKNTRSNAVEVAVVDQVPVSDDERLKVQILEPKGLVQEGDDAQMKEGAVHLGKAGEVKWVVKLAPGKEVKLVLEYEARVPAGSEVSEV